MQIPPVIKLCVHSAPVPHRTHKAGLCLGIQLISRTWHTYQKNQPQLLFAFQGIQQWWCCCKGYEHSFCHLAFFCRAILYLGHWKEEECLKKKEISAKLTYLNCSALENNTGSGRNNRRDLAGTCVMPAQSNQSLLSNMRTRQALLKQCPFFTQHHVPLSLLLLSVPIPEPCWCCSLSWSRSCVRLRSLLGRDTPTTASKPCQDESVPPGAQLPSLPDCQETMPLGMPVSATMSDTRTARAAKVMQIPSDFWRGWVFGETGSLWGKPEKTNHRFVNHSHPCLCLTGKLCQTQELLMLLPSS